ncbi:MAG: methyltransferase domain-containing protein [Bryobacterales bacterium]|nr:methyltransferase domain-containing protein [Bryobacterales bacterium]
MRHSERLHLRNRRPLVQPLFLDEEPPRSEAHSHPFPVIPHFSDLRELHGWFAFASQFFADFRTTASVVPSSPHLAREMVAPVREIKAKVVLEFGPGTGPMTSQLLAALPETGHLYCFEVNPRFVEYLNDHFPDERMRVMEMGAERAPEVMAASAHLSADAVVSSLPLSFFPSDLRHAILSAAAECLRPGGVFTQFQYASGLDCSGRIPKPYDLRPKLGRYFSRVERHMVWLNFPPAWVYRCYRD